jgi:hypothetical protein
MHAFCVCLVVIAPKKGLLIFMKLCTMVMSRVVNPNDFRAEVVWKQYAVPFILWWEMKLYCYLYLMRKIASKQWEISFRVILPMIYVFKCTRVCNHVNIIAYPEVLLPSYSQFTCILQLLMIRYCHHFGSDKTRENTYFTYRFMNMKNAIYTNMYVQL